MINISVILPTYNPDIPRLTQTLNGLKLQSLPAGDWELIIIDNNSYTSFSNQIDISWHPNSHIIHEQLQGLTYARIKGFTAARGNIIVMVDDDNVLNSDYLSETLSIFKDETLGAIGGKSLPIFETGPPAWVKEFYGCLALRDIGDDIIIEQWKNSYPVAAPIGAGMAIRKKTLESYINKIQRAEKITTDRSGNSLSSGGDNDMIIEILKSGWSVGYFPSLVLHHLIPQQRMQPNYLARLNRDTNKSWVQLLEKHGINPWKKITRYTVLLRKIKAWFTYKAWKSNITYINWKGACGMYNGLIK